MLAALDIAASALVAQRANIDVIAGNIAMKDAYREEGGGFIPYRRRTVLMAPGNPSAGEDARGVHVAAVVEDPSPFGLKWAPGSPYAIRDGAQQGYVRVSNVNYHTEMVNALVAARAYEANVTVMETAKSMASSALRLIA
ncbi:MAG: flagellar basal body rod protein FlgC [Phycisphaerae bacterium]